MPERNTQMNFLINGVYLMQVFFINNVEVQEMG